MSESATPTKRSERMAATASRITALSRRLTAERGLNGFTIEELCEAVGVSRRTFFNYFPSKEEAVLGLDETAEARRLADEFLARGSRGWPAVVDDLVDFAVAHARDAGIGRDEHAELIGAISREPRLLARFIDMTREREQQLGELVARREGVASRHPLVLASVHTVAAAMRIAGEHLLDDRPGDDFETALTDAVAALREVLAAPSRG
ncbi:TetR family transcriptional regulator [Agromyces bracchium]|uniref:TetR family transcriptional regulator n=1 Tax=Agromyces bracchium TaxID=88376 RepID=A0A6I3M2A5_9MICO|nr:TetR family transcriptional regulator [Agromyces bracchium]MTH67038.1 TetR family transcriptional regulator [Agromyces bracchium]